MSAQEAQKVMNITGNREQVYNTLKEEFDNLGTFKDFNAHLENEGNRRQVYNVLKERFDNLGTWEDFNAHIYEAPVEPAAGEGLTGPTALTHVEERQTGQPDDWRQAMSRRIGQAAAEGHAALQGARAFAGDMDEYGEQRLRGMGMDMSRVSGAVVAQAGGRSGEPVDAQTGQTSMTGLTPQGMWAQAQAQVEAERPELTTRRQLRRLEARMAQTQRQLDERGRELLAQQASQGSRGPSWLAAMADAVQGDRMGGRTGATIEESPDFEADRQYQALKLTLRKQKEELVRLRNAVSNQENGDGFWTNFFRSASQQVFNWENWDFGKGVMGDAQAMLALNQRVESGQELTADEKNALKELAAWQNVMDTYGDLGRGDRWGSVTGYMIPLMKDFALTGGGFVGLTTKLPGALAKYVARAAVARAGSGVAGREIALEIAKNGIKQYVRTGGKGALGRAVAAQGRMGLAATVATRALGVGLEDMLVRAPLLTFGVQARNTAANIIETKLGPVEVDEQTGDMTFANDKSWGEAAWEAGADALIENFSEISGGRMLGVDDLARVFGARNLTAAVLRSTRENAGTVLSKTVNFLKRGGVNGYFGEVGEEYVGQLWRTALGLESSQTPVYDENGAPVYKRDANGEVIMDEKGRPVQEMRNNMLSGRFHGDIWGGMLLSVGMMGAGGMAIGAGGRLGSRSAQYISNKHQLSVANTRAAAIFPKEEWEGIRNVIDGTDNADMGALAETMLRDQNLSDEEREAVMNYMERAMVFRGYNLGEILQSRAGAQPGGVASELDTAYTDGYEAMSERERTAIMNEYTGRREALEQLVGADVTGQLDDDAVGTLQTMADSGQYSEGVMIAAMGYANVKMMRDGLQQRQTDDVEERIAQSDAMISGRVNKDTGMIQPATMMLDDRAVYVVSGKVSVNADGSIDREATDQNLIVRDAQTGKLEFIDGRSLKSAGAAIDPAQERAAAAEQLREAAASQMLQEAPQETEGPTPEVGDVYTIVDGNGQQVDVTLVSEQPGGGEYVVEWPDGHTSTMTSAELAAAARMPQGDSQTAEVGGQTGQTIPTSPTQLQVPEEAPQEAPQEAEDRTPQAEDRTPSEVWDSIVEEAEGDEDIALEVVSDYVEEAAADLKAAEKRLAEAKGNTTRMSRRGQTLAERVEAKRVAKAAVAEAEAMRDKAQAELDRWRAISGERQRRRAQALSEQQAAEREAAEVRYAEEQRQKAEREAEQRAVGANAVNGRLKEKWDAAPKITGHAMEHVLADGSTIKGHYVLTEAGAATASHDPERGYARTEGFPVDENGQSVNDRDYERDKDAQRIVEQMARTYDSRALQTPVIVSQDGVVLSGNNRTMSGDIAAQQGTDAAYVDHLKRYGGMYGFSAEQIAGMKHPRVVFVADEAMPYTSGTFARFNAQEMKSQSKPEAAVKLGKTVPDDVFVAIMDDINGYERMSDYYANEGAAARALGRLHAAGVINDAQMPELRTGTSLSAAGRELLENLLIGKAFQSDPDAVRKIMSVPSMRQSIVMALAEIANNRALAAAGYDLISELSVAVDLCYRAKQAQPEVYKLGVPVSPWGRMQGLFDSESGESSVTDAMTLLLADMLNDTKPSRLRNVLTSYNKEAGAAAAGSRDLFSGEVPTKETILSEINNYFNNATPKELQARVDAAIAERRAAAGSESGTDGQGAVEAQTAAAGGGIDGHTRDAGGNSDGSDNMAEGEQSEIGYALSENEQDENGEPMVMASDGSTTFGQIDSESGLKAAPIRLSKGRNRKDENGQNIGYGLLHIEAGHGDQIRAAGYNSVEEFVEKVAKNYTVIREGSRYGDSQSYLLEVTDGHNNTLFIQLSHDGTYWNVNSAGIFRERYSRRKPIISSLPTIGSSSNAETAEVNHGQNEGAAVTSGNSSEIYGGKVNDSASEKQASEGESLQAAVKMAESDVEPNPTEAQKKAGNYKKGHVKVGAFDVTIEQSVGSIRRGRDANGKSWESEMHNAYGYIRGTEGVDGDHIDVFLSTDLDGWDGRSVYVVDQYNPDGTFDEHKVMLGFNDKESARAAYLSNYEPGWESGRRLEFTAVSMESFEKWIESSHRKTKAFAEYKSVKGANGQAVQTSQTEAEADGSKTGQDAQLHAGSEVEGNREVYEVAKGLLESAGIEVVEVSEAEAADMLGYRRDATLSTRKKRALDTLNGGSAQNSKEIGLRSNHQDPVISFNDGAKVRNNLDKLASDIEKDGSAVKKNLIGFLSSALGLRNNGNKSNYGTFEAKNGVTVRIRISDHNAEARNFDDAGFDNGISIVISRKGNAGLTNNGGAHIVEYYYNGYKLAKAGGHPLAEIARSLKQALYSGEYNDTTGLAVRQEVNPRFSIRTYHGTDANFDSFDLSHIGEGEGRQAYGWGGYVTEVKGIGKTYASDIAGAHLRPKIEKVEGNIKQAKSWLKKYGDWSKYEREGRRHLRELQKELRAAEKNGNSKDADFYRDLIKLQEESLNEDAHRSLVEEKHRQIAACEDELASLKEGLSGSRHLYTVRIPDDTGVNYLDWDKPMSKEQRGMISTRAEQEGFMMDFYGDTVTVEEYFNKTGKDEEGFLLYRNLTRSLGSDRAASEFLSRAGFTGIKYSANHNNGGRADGKKNYVLFKESDMRISDHVRYLKDGADRVYGWTVGGKVYLNKDAMNPETPVHEYTHLWDEMVRRENPELWARGVELMKQTPLWDDVISDPNYADIRDDEDAVASEVHARLTGNAGATILGEMVERSRAEGALEVARTVTLVERIKGWLRDMFGELKGTLSKWSGRELEELTAEDFARMTLRDLAEGRLGQTGQTIQTDRTDRSGVRFHAAMSRSRDEFKATLDRAVAERGIVMPGLNEMEVRVVDVPRHDFKGTGKQAIDKARSWAEKHLVGEYVAKEGTVERFTYEIERAAIGKYLSSSSTLSSENLGVHLAVLKQLPTIINNSIEAEVHPDYKKDVEKKRRSENGLNDYGTLIHRMYGAVRIDDELYRVKITMKELLDKDRLNPYNYQVTELELLISGSSASDALSNSNQIVGANLLKDVEKSYDKGKKLLEESKKQSESGTESDEEDLLYRTVTDEDTLERLNSKPTIKVYRAMQLIDGGLRPPMSAKVDGKLREASELGVWEEAEERPELADGNGRFKLNKGNGSSIMAAYNPYFHTSRSPINDQFSSAWSRPELVIVEVEIPESELTSGYRAEKAKNPVGEYDWKSGPVGRALAKIGQARKVILSRWSKIVRVVPVAEVAEAYAQRLNARGIEVPFNTVPPALREALVACGVKIGKPEKGNAGAASQKAYEQWVSEREKLERQGDGYGAYSDAEVSYENDPISKALGENRFSKKRQSEFAARERRRMGEHIEELAKRLHLDNVEVVTDVSELDGRRAKAKGYYNKRTGKITIVIPNNLSTIDAEQTLLHEAVAHYGLRKLFGGRFDTFLDNVYEAAEERIREQIDVMAAKNGWNRRTATEEYLATLAENTNFNETRNKYTGWWVRIKQQFLNMLDEIGFKGFRDSTGVVLTDNELRYILWRSYKNLTDPGMYRSFVSEAEDVAKQSELKVGNYAEGGITAEYAAEPAGVSDVNEVFNQQLERYAAGEMSTHELLHLGFAKGVMKAFLPALPIVMRQRILNKASEKKHNVDIASLSDLPEKITEPIFVFQRDANTIGVLTEIKDREGKNVCVAIELNKTIQNGGEYLEVNEIRTIHGREVKNIILPILHNNTLQYADKEKGLAWLSSASYNYQQEIAQQDLESAAKVVENFENPTIEEEELFRDGDFTPRDKVLARDYYERMCSRGLWQLREALQDSMLGLKTLYQAILGKDTRIEDVAGYENAYLAENRMSSSNEGQGHEYFVRYMRPLLEAVSKIAGSNERKRRELTDYMMAKHGLERNAYMRQKAATDGKDTERDFAGLTALTGESDWRTAEAVAQKWVSDYESEHDTKALWAAVNEATKASLEKLYRSGILSKKVYEEVRDMYRYYVPLRGWDQTTSDEVYGYFMSKDGPLGGSVMKRAEGRSSKADDPIATISMMADDAIRQGNRNEMKQRFLNFVLNHPSDAVSVNDLWLEYDDVSGEWRPVFADVKATDSAEDAARKIEAFEKRMELMKQSNPAKYKRGRETADIPYKVVKNHEREHQVLVKRNGRTYVLTINGNPRAAQALNGLTNPDVNADGVLGQMEKAATRVNRFISAAVTTRNPSFIASNFARDMIYSNSAVWLKEKPRYAMDFNKNCARFSPFSPRRVIRLHKGVAGGTVYSMGMLLRKWESGTLNMSDHYENLFYQFMKNGGETGYTNVRDIEKHKQTVARELKKHGNKMLAAISALGEQLDLVNRAVENCARFAAFVTSIEHGRSVERAIYDAKEISVNFNKKGSGGKMMDAKGQSRLGRIGAQTGGFGRLMYIFWNAGIQGMTNFGRIAYRHRGKFIAAAGTMFALGVLQPMLAEIVGGGDDDENGYWNLPEYVRRSNICIKAGGNWVTIPLPIEMRAIFGLGELGYGVLSGNERYSNKELAYQMASQVSQVLPLDMLEGGGGLTPLIPSGTKPIVEAYVLNKSWSGTPIYKESPYNKHEPEWRRVYKNVDPYLMSLSRWLNESTGGGDHEKGAININPAKLEYVLKGMLGGMYTMPSEVKSTVETAAGTREFDWHNIPVANRFIKNSDERTAYRRLNNEYYRYKDEYDETTSRLRAYRKDNAQGILGAAERINFIENSPEYARWQIFGVYKKRIDLYGELIGNAPEGSREQKEYEAGKYATMRELIEALRDPEAFFERLDGGNQRDQ